MDLNEYLQSADLIDCQGRISHRLTLRLNGMVDVTFAAGHTAVADPRTRCCMTPGMAIPDSLWPKIVALGV